MINKHDKIKTRGIFILLFLFSFLIIELSQVYSYTIEVKNITDFTIPEDKINYLFALMNFSAIECNNNTFYYIFPKNVFINDIDLFDEKVTYRDSNFWHRFRLYHNYTVLNLTKEYVTIKLDSCSSKYVAVLKPNLIYNEKSKELAVLSIYGGKLVFQKNHNIKAIKLEKLKLYFFKFFKNLNVTVLLNTSNGSLRETKFLVKFLKEVIKPKIETRLTYNDLIQSNLNLILNISSMSYEGWIKIKISCLSKTITCDNQSKKIYLKRNEKKQLSFSIVPKLTPSNIKVPSYTLVDKILNYEIKDILAKTSLDPIMIKITFEGYNFNETNVVSKKIISVYFEPTRIYDILTLVIVIFSFSYFFYVFFVSETLKKLTRYLKER